MKKAVSLGLIAAFVLALCSCDSTERIYSTYNPNVYYGMSQSQVNKILSEEYSTVNSGDEITYNILIAQDFINIDPQFAFAPEVSYKFDSGKLEKITQTYDFPDGLSSDIADSYNTYLALALKVDEESLDPWTHEMSDGSVWTYFQTASYENDNELITFVSSNSIDGCIDSISISFSPKKTYSYF